MSTADNFDKAYEFLKSKIIKHPSISGQFKNLLLEVLKNEQETVKIISNKFKLDIKFLKVFIDLANKHLKPKTDAEHTKYDKMLYREFKRLKKFELIHKSSVSYLPRNLVLVSINPNHTVLFANSYSKLDRVNKAIVEYENDSENISEKSNILQQIYFYLRLFHILPFTLTGLERICWKDIIFPPVSMAVLVIYEDSFLASGVDAKGPKPYKTVILDKFVSEMLKRAYLSIDNIDEKVFKNIHEYENIMNNNRAKLSIEDISINELRQLIKIRYMYLNSPFALTLRTGSVTPVQLSLADIEAMFPGTVSKELMKDEMKRIKSALGRPIMLDIEDEMDWQIITFDIYELDELVSLLRYKDNMPPKELVENALFELRQELKASDSLHLNMIYKYLIYLIDLLKRKRIQLSTAKNYIWLLNKHLFRMIEDFYDIKEYEVLRISNRLSSHEYKGHYINRIKAQITRFFKYFLRKGIAIDVAGSFYPKSLVFKNEIECIMEAIEVEYKAWKNIQKIGRYHKLYLTQLKVIVLLGFYCGLRLKEVSALLLKDIYLYGDNLHVDINSKGIKKIGFKLKTVSSKRRIDVVVDNPQHLKVITEFLNKREMLNKKSQFLFLELSQQNGFISKPINASSFEYINEIIQSVTKRYCSYHSLRHSFATYQCHSFFQEGSSYPYAMLELSSKMGHRTPDTTVNSYIHNGFLFLNANQE